MQQRACRALRGMTSFRENGLNEHIKNFGAYNCKGKQPAFGKPPPAKRPKKSTPWTHQFVCLDKCNQLKAPMTYIERQRLLEAGLGEKKVTFTDVDCVPEEYREILYHAFPKLEGAGGFELMRCCCNSRMLELLPAKALYSPRCTRERLGRSKGYIRPIQKDLDMSRLEEDDTTESVLVSYR